MLVDFADELVWLLRLMLLAGLGWGGWLCLGAALLPAKSEKTVQFEHFATFALLILLFTVLGAVLHTG